MNNEVVKLQVNTLFNVNDEDVNAMLGVYAYTVDQVQSQLTPDLLKPEYRAINETNPMYGHCYVASEVIYHLFEPGVLQPYYGKDDEGVTHWWLVDEKRNIRVDATCDQYYSIGKEPPYDKGVRASFLTNEPSKRCRIVTERLSYNADL